MLLIELYQVQFRPVVPVDLALCRNFVTRRTFIDLCVAIKTPPKVFDPLIKKTLKLKQCFLNCLIDLSSWCVPFKIIMEGSMFSIKLNKSMR